MYYALSKTVSGRELKTIFSSRICTIFAAAPVSGSGLVSSITSGFFNFTILPFSLCLPMVSIGVV